MTNEECQQMQKNVLEYLRNDATDGDRAIVTMLTILVNQMSAQHDRLQGIEQSVDQLASQFDAVTSSGAIYTREAR